MTATGTPANATKPALPEGWRWVRVGQVCVQKTGTRNPSLQPDKSFRYVDITSVDARTKRITEPKSLLGKDAPSRARQVIHAGDVLVSTTRPNLNAVALVPHDLNDQVCSTGFCVLRAEAELNRDFLFAFVQSSGFVHDLSELVKGALYPAVNDGQVREQEIPLPPLAEQKRIAAVLTEQMSAVEKARAATEARLDAAKALPAAYLRAVFNSPHAQLWPTIRLDLLCDLLPSKSISTDGDRDVQTITTACLTESGFDPLGVKPAKMWAADADQCVVSPGEVLVARSNTPELVGRVSMFNGMPAGSVASDLTIRLLPKGGIDPQFLTRYLSFLYLSGYWRSRAGGASGSMKKITRTQIQSQAVPLPAAVEQRGVAGRLSEQIADAEKVRKGLEAELDSINRLPAALLRRAFNGEL